MSKVSDIVGYIQVDEKGYDFDYPDLMAEIMRTLGCNERQTNLFIDLVLQDIKLFDKKQHDYGPGNISAFGEKGLLVRTNDKMERLKNLIWNKDEDPENESIEDTWQDLSIYGAIARLVRSNRWL